MTESRNHIGIKTVTAGGFTGGTAQLREHKKSNAYMNKWGGGSVYQFIELPSDLKRATSWNGRQLYPADNSLTRRARIREGIGWCVLA